MNHLPRRESAERRTAARLACLALLSLTLSSCAEDHIIEVAPPRAASDAPEAGPAHIDAALRVALDESGSAEVIVLHEEPADLMPGGAEGTWTHTTSGVTVRSPLPYAEIQARILAALQPGSFELLQRFEQLPYLFVRVHSQAALDQLAALREVRWLYENRLYTASLSESLGLIKQPAVQAQGMVGESTSVAVLDTGCDFTREAFGSCSSPGGNCKVAFARDFAVEDNQRDASGHGTNVSAIVLGVAPSSKVLALDVFNGESASSTSILSAVDWVVQNRDTYNITAMNLSLGAGLFTAACPNDLFAAAMAKARAAQVLPVVATGNNGAINAVASPACVPGVISVGAVYDAVSPGMSFPNANCTDTSPSADKVACFSNSASFMSLLAPGARITAGGMTSSGTSQAAPHVAGAVAVIRARFPNETLDEVGARLVKTGPLVTDSRNGVKKPRLDLDAALASTTPLDVAGPTASLGINEGATITRTARVTLALSASDPSGVASVCFSNADTCTQFVAYATSTSWLLTSGDGVKKVTAWVKDSVGNVTKVSATITLDGKRPADGLVVPTPADAAVSLAWSNFTDANGVVSYIVVYALDAAPANCTVGTQVYRGSDGGFTHSDLINGKLYAYRVCGVDAAGNVSAGRVVSARPRPEFAPPTGSVRINSGESYTPSKTLTIGINAADDSSISMMCISTTISCKNWVPYASSSTLITTKSSGVLTVNVWLRDEWTNTMTAPISASIGIDTKAPSLTTFTSLPTNAGLVLSWVAATDADSGVALYRLLVAAGSSAPSDCQSGTVLAETRDLTVTHQAKGSFAYRLCAKDNVGNWTATGKTLKAIIP